MSRSKRAPWVKLYADFTSTPSHDELDAMSLWVGVCILLTIRASNDARGTRDPWALHEDGSAINIRAIAHRARLSLAATRRAVAALAACGTVIWREDGVLGVPKFWEYQETPDAKRKRDGKPPESPPKVRDDSRQDISRGEREESSGDANASPPREAKPKRRKSGQVAPSPLAVAVMTRIDDHRKRLGMRPLAPSQRDPSAIEQRISDGADRDTLLAVVDARAAELERGDGKPEFFNAAAPFTWYRGRGGWQWSLGLLDRATKRNGKAEPSDFRDQTPGDVDWSKL